MLMRHRRLCNGALIPGVVNASTTDAGLASSWSVTLNAGDDHDDILSMFIVGCHFGFQRWLVALRVSKKLTCCSCQIVVFEKVLLESIDGLVVMPRSYAINHTISH
jgi:hypothetical protein